MKSETVSLRLWMKISLTLASAVNICLGVVLVGFVHEACKLMGVPKPVVKFPLQIAGVGTVCMGLGYLRATLEPLKMRTVLAFCFVIHTLVSIWIAAEISGDRLPLQFLCFVLAIAAVDLFPMAPILWRLFFEINSKEALVKINRIRGGTNETNGSRSPHSFLRPAAKVAMLLATWLPPSWALAHAYSNLTTSWSVQRRPAKWTPIKTNLPTAIDEEFSYTAVDVWPKRRFIDPTFVCELPDGSGRMAVLERMGRIRIFSKDSTDDSNSDVLLDITDRTMQVPHAAEDGLLGLAFHPHYADPNSPQRGWIFVRYTANIQGKRSNRLSRFTVTPGSNTADPKSESILIDLPEETMIHKGGAVEFGPDGFLYTTFGTDGSSLPNPHAQRIDEGLWAGVLRIDIDCQGAGVSHPPPRQPLLGKTDHYFIPDDNPFVGTPSAMEEFYSIGFRNPWRMTVDRKTGWVWVGDTGDRRREEINICSAGSNHQWDYFEGTLSTSTYDPSAPERPEHIVGTETPPVFEYQHEGLMHCVIGGYVYRGSKFPELVGKYVYADQCGRIFALSVDDQRQLIGNEMIGVIREPGLGVSSLGVDAQGELYFCCIFYLGTPGSRIYRLDRSIQHPDHQLPQTLSATGLFIDLKSLKPNPALIPYEVNSPLWSDRAQKQRWIGLVSREKINGELEGRWTFPTGTVFVKEFDLPLDEREIAAEHDQRMEPKPTVRRLETRVLVCDDHGGVFGASYRWNEEQTEAYLVNSSAIEDIEYDDRNGVPTKQTWFYPGRVDCQACHNSHAGGVLGFNSRQLNREVIRDGLGENQMQRFSKAGMFSFDCTTDILSHTIKLAALDDTSASIEHRVRSYLDANCSHCHQPGGSYGLWDARIQTPLELQQIVDGMSVTHQGQDPLARVVMPGDLDHSYLYYRMASTEPHLRMPALGRLVVHQAALDLVKQWILSMPITDTRPKSLATPQIIGQDY